MCKNPDHPDEYGGWKIEEVGGTDYYAQLRATRHGVGMGAPNWPALKRMIDIKHYEAREEKRLRGEPVGMF